MQIDDNFVAHVTLGELHDILAGAHHFHHEEEDADYPIEEYRIATSDTDKLTDKQYDEAREIVTELNKLLRRYRELDARFHDAYDCR